MAGLCCQIDEFLYWMNVMYISLYLLSDSGSADLMRKACGYKQEKETKPDTQLLQTCFNAQSAAQTAYNLEVFKV